MEYLGGLLSYLSWVAEKTTNILVMTVGYYLNSN